MHRSSRQHVHITLALTRALGNIQHGYMKMHLINILNQYNASDDEKIKAIEYFKSNNVNYNNVNTFIDKLRNDK